MHIQMHAGLQRLHPSGAKMHPRMLTTVLGGSLSPAREMAAILGSIHLSLIWLVVTTSTCSCRLGSLCCLLKLVKCLRVPELGLIAALLTLSAPDGKNLSSGDLVGVLPLRSQVADNHENSEQEN